MFVACLIAPAASAAGGIAIAGVVAAWLVACRPPRRRLASALLLGALLFLPYFLLVPMVHARSTFPAETSWSRALSVPWAVLLHGMACMLVSAGAASSLDMSDLRRGLSRLPIPAMAVLILIQILHQSATLAAETRRISMAMAVRGASGRRGAAWRVLSSLPRVWLPRIFERADRVAAAMEVRGYCEADLRSFPRDPLKGADAITIIATSLLIGTSIAIRFLGMP